MMMDNNILPIDEMTQMAAYARMKLSVLSFEKKMLLHCVVGKVLDGVDCEFCYITRTIDNYIGETLKMQHRISSGQKATQTQIKKADKLLPLIMEETRDEFANTFADIESPEELEDETEAITAFMIIISAINLAVHLIDNQTDQAYLDSEPFLQEVLEQTAQHMEGTFLKADEDDPVLAKGMGDLVRHLCDERPFEDDEDREYGDPIDEKVYNDIIDMLTQLDTRPSLGKTAAQQRKASQKLTPKRPVQMELRIQIEGISTPPVWRKVSLPGHLTFDKLHLVIQHIFGWHQAHLYQFMRTEKKPVKSTLFIETANTPPNPFLDPNDSRCERLVCEKTRLYDVLNPEHPKIVYEYDFGDGWEHSIELLKYTEGETSAPKVLAGKGKCPPEDCGGPMGYMYLKQVMTNPKHPEYKERKEWLTDWMDYTFDPTHFDLEETQSRLDSLRLK